VNATGDRNIPQRAWQHVVIEKGKVVEIGTNMELLKKKGIYFGLVIAQRDMTKHKTAS
jgi:ATP-binding cassette subfamily B protein